MRIVWEMPTEPGPEVTRLRIGTTAYGRRYGEPDHYHRGSPARSWWYQINEIGARIGSEESWDDLIYFAVDANYQILDATPVEGES